MTFRVIPLQAALFQKYYSLSDAVLKQYGVIACMTNTKPGFPCRVSLRDAEPGERVLLLNYTHLPVDNPYRASHAIFVIDGAVEFVPEINEVPDVLVNRLLSVRAFDVADMMIDAALIDGRNAGDGFKSLFIKEEVSYLHVHNAKRGCFAAKVERVG